MSISYLAYPSWLARLFQRWHLGRSRMGRLLQRRQVDVGAYLQASPILDIEAQLARCYACEHKPLCDRALASPAPGRSRYSFCPNSPAVERFVAAARTRVP
jgi:hypothetical protein